MLISAAILMGAVWGAGFAGGNDPMASALDRILGRRIHPAVPVTTAGSHKFAAVVNGSPVAYSPCKSIRYELNLTQAPPGSEGALGRAIQEVERVTGLNFEYVGTSERRPLDKTSHHFALGSIEAQPVIISWATPDEAPALAGDVAGYAGSSYRTDGRHAHFETGQVVFDSEVFTQLLRTPDGSAHVRAIAMHELGHLVGLAHVRDERELMNGHNSGRLGFGPGDLAGLALLGQGDC